jgi:hypothetical protein
MNAIRMHLKIDNETKYWSESLLAEYPPRIVFCGWRDYV